MRPAAGVIGLVAHPLQGAWKGVQKTWAKDQEQAQRSTRISDGVEDVKGSTKEERKMIMERWVELKKTTRQRQKKYREEAEKVLNEEKAADSENNHAVKASSLSSTGNCADVSPASLVNVSATTGGQASQQTAEERPIITGADDTDAAFDRDLEMAKMLSLAEQRGYERGLASRLG
jgi:sterol 3beta-glucosyltransferase